MGEGMPDGTQVLEALKEKLRQLDEECALGHRLRRCVSWLERASAENDADAKYILLWVAFNAAYVVERKAEFAHWGRLDEWERQEKYFERLTGVGFRRIHFAIRGRLRRPVDRLMDNVYIFWGFWDSLTDEPFDWDNWRHKRRFESERSAVREQMGIASAPCTMYVLNRVFNRLYVVRNQLMHGCATQDGTLNRRQVQDGGDILEALVPLFFDMMVDHPEVDWGKISYPVRDDIREDRRGMA